jgi:uncharacterized protein involved in exopolysaccharide biosynthesis
MPEQAYNGHDRFEENSHTMRDYVGIIFRHRRLVIIAFLGTFLGVLLVTIFVVARRFQAETYVLIKHEREDPFVSPSANEQPQVANDLIPEEEVNTEVNMLQSAGLLKDVVIACGLQNVKTLSDYILFFRHLTPEERIARAEQALASKLDVEELTKTHLADITYVSGNPVTAASVLNTLTKLYMEKHLEIHRPPEELAFFEKETARYQKELADAESRLSGYDHGHNAVNAQLERDTTVQNLTQFTATLRTTQGQIASTRDRIQDLDKALSAMSGRMLTSDHLSDASTLLENLKSLLLNLELQRTQLLTKYEPTYPLVQQVDKEIADTHDAIAAAQKSPVHDYTTDRDPAWEALREDLAKSKADLAQYQGLAEATADSMNTYRRRTLELDQQSLDQQDLQREVTASQNNYLLYLRKREEARISDAMDARRMVNVTVAMPALVPVLPQFSPLLFGVLGFILSVIIGLGSAFAAEYFNPSFGTPDEVAEFLEVPVFASIPQNAN